MTEAELLYRQSVNDARIHQDELVKVKERIISHIRKLICQGDTVLKEVGMKSRKLNICLPVITLLDSLFSAALHSLCRLLKQRFMAYNFASVIE